MLSQNKPHLRQAFKPMLIGQPIKLSHEHQFENLSKPSRSNHAHAHQRANMTQLSSSPNQAQYDYITQQLIGDSPGMTHKNYKKVNT